MTSVNTDRIQPDLVIAPHNHITTADGSFDPIASAVAQERYQNDLWLQDNIAYGEERLVELHDSSEKPKRLNRYHFLGSYLTGAAAVITLPLVVDAAEGRIYTPKDVAAVSLGVASIAGFSVITQKIKNAINRHDSRVDEILDQASTHGPTFDEIRRYRQEM